MEKDAPLNVLVLNASLKHSPEVSSTQEVVDLVLAEMPKYSAVNTVVIRLADKNIPVGLTYNVGPCDEWPTIVEEIKKADIILFATPIWWGGRSSLMQRIIERMDAFDEDVIAGGRSVLLNKVAGIVITGSEDGAQATLAGIMEVLTFMNFTLPPACCTYWVGEVGMDPKTDAERRRANPAVQHMAANTAKNTIYFAKLFREHPLLA